MKRVVIDKDIGPTSITVLHKKEYDIIFSANHGIGNVVMYKVKQ